MYRYSKRNSSVRSRRGDGAPQPDPNAALMASPHISSSGVVPNDEHLISPDGQVFVSMSPDLAHSFSFFFQSCGGVKVIWRADWQDRRVVRHAVQTGGHHWCNHPGESLQSEQTNKTSPGFMRQRFLTAPVFQKWAGADLNGKFKLPMKNEFIPTNFEIYPLEKDSPSVPTLIKASVSKCCRPSLTNRSGQPCSAPLCSKSVIV